MSRFRFMNIWLDNITMAEAVDRIEELARGNRPAYVVTPNVDHLIRVENDSVFRDIYEKADLVLADGQPLIWISKLYKTPIREKISGSDLFPRLCERAAQSGLKMFFLGAAEGIAALAAQKLQAKYPGLQVCGTYSPPYGVEKDENETTRILQLIHQADPDILILGLGTPKQEKFLKAHLTELDVPVSLGLGASLDFEAGNIRRAPAWMSRCGLEWFYRLLKEPRRLFKRYLVDDMKIVWLMFKYWKGRK